jgi:hypothetical protein
MSDAYITIVPTNVTQGQVKDLSKMTIAWLSEKGIILTNQTDCVLGETLGYPPGPKYMDAIDGDDFGLLKLRTNGLAAVTERQVFDNGENGLDEINCPKCGANNIDSDWGEAVGLWDTGKIGILRCSQCDNEASIADYDFRPDWGFGEFGLTFWNWPLSSRFFDDLRVFVGTDIKIIYGRL